jgi:2-C-methyl-D-erythritol 4-phosphate cytidylyltransferase
LRIVQTPQTFKSDVLRRAYDVEFSPQFTDDASVVEAQGYAITLVEGERSNIKLTTPEDLLFAEWLLQREV